MSQRCDLDPIASFTYAGKAKTLCSRPFVIWPLPAPLTCLLPPSPLCPWGCSSHMPTHSASGPLHLPFPLLDLYPQASVWATLLLHLGFCSRDSSPESPHHSLIPHPVSFESTSNHVIFHMCIFTCLSSVLSTRMQALQRQRLHFVYCHSPVLKTEPGKKIKKQSLDYSL